MGAGMLLPEGGVIHEAIKPQTGGSARSGDWVSLKGYEKCLILVHIGQNNAATTEITVDKATDVSGTGESTGITLNNWWSAEDSAGVYTKGTAASSITSSDTGSGSSVYLIEVRAEELGAYDCIQVECGASNAANYISALYILYPGRYQQATPISAVTN